MNEVFYLTPGDRASGTWVRLLGYLKDELANKRAKLEGDIPEEQTQALRAQIRLLKSLVDLDTKAPDTN